MWLIHWLGAKVVAIVHMPLPENVLGMLLLFSMLALGIIKPRYLQEAVNLLLTHFAFFFIPISVGLMAWGALIYKNGFVLVAALVLSALIAVGVTGQAMALTAVSTSFIAPAYVPFLLGLLGVLGVLGAPAGF